MTIPIDLILVEGLLCGPVLVNTRTPNENNAVGLCDQQRYDMSFTNGKGIESPPGFVAFHPTEHRRFVINLIPYQLDLYGHERTV
jgi:hypothetical protein